MPKTETILKVFVASPSDVTEERRLLEEVIQELNIIWSDTLDIRLDLIRWETHSAPGFGDDVQDVINKQISNSYDIFIGLMWTRFGTPTKRADSGTAEEFKRAYARHKQDPGSVEIMFYFKNTPISPSDIDPDQLRDVLEFKSHLGDLGGLYSQFDSTDEFQNSVRVHLGLLVSKWARRLKREGVPHEPSSELTPKAPDGSKEEEEGFLDLIETAQNSIKILSRVFKRFFYDFLCKMKLWIRNFQIKSFLPPQKFLPPFFAIEASSLQKTLKNVILLEACIFKKKAVEG